jgi:hypothetical protein
MKQRKASRVTTRKYGEIPGISVPEPTPSWQPFHRDVTMTHKLTKATITVPSLEIQSRYEKGWELR